MSTATIRRRVPRAAHTAAIVFPLLALMLAGCASTPDGGTPDAGGLGELLGRIGAGGGDYAMAGPGVGEGIGYVIGNEEDRGHARALAESTRDRDFEHSEVGALGDTRWNVEQMIPANFVGAFAGMTVEFGPAGRITTRTTKPDGSIDTTRERYRVVNATLIMNRPGYLVNTSFAIDGDRLTVDGEWFRAILVRK